MARKHLSNSPVSAWTFKSPGHVLLSGVTRMDCSCHTNSCQTNFQALSRVNRLLVICCLPHMGNNKRQKLLLLSYWHLQLSSKWSWYIWVVQFIITAGDWGRLCCDCSQPSVTFAIRFLVSKYPHFSAVQFFFVVYFSTWVVCSRSPGWTWWPVNTTLLKFGKIPICDTMPEIQSSYVQAVFCWGFVWTH